MKLVSHLLLCLLILFSSSLESLCQKNNIQLGVSKYKFYNVNDRYVSPYKQYKIGYERKLNRFLSVGANYSRTQRGSLVTLEGEYKWLEPADPDRLITRRDYDFINIYLVYRHKLSDNQRIQFGIGPSLTFGENEYITDIFYSPPGTFSHVMLFVEYKNEIYYGGIAFLKYDNFFWKKRINVGTNIEARYYHDFPFSITYGLHAGYNF